MIKTIEELEKYSVHIEDIKKRLLDNKLAVSFLDMNEVYRFYVHARNILDNMGKHYNLFIKVEMLEREEVLILLKYLNSVKKVDKSIEKLLNSNDRENIKLGIQIIKNGL